MIKQFLKQTMKQYEKSVISDLERLTQQLNLENECLENRYDIFYNLAEIYNSFDLHCRYLTEKKGYSDSLYHRELEAIEDFIKYLIDLYKFPQSFEKLVEGQKKQTAYIFEANQIWVIDAEDFESIETTIEQEDKEVSDLGIKESPDFDFEDF
jgi:predicted DNA-binding protein